MSLCQGAFARERGFARIETIVREPGSAKRSQWVKGTARLWNQASQQNMRQAYKIELGELLDHNENGNWGAEWKINKSAFFQNNIVKISEQTVNISSTGHACHCDETWWNSVTAASCLDSAAKGWKAQIHLHQRIIWTNWWLCARMKSNEMGLMPVSFFNPSELSSRSQLKWQILCVYLYVYMWW